MHAGFLIAPGELFSALDSDIKQINTNGGEPRPGELFSGLDSDTLNKSVLTVGEPGPGRGNFFFSESDI